MIIWFNKQTNIQLNCTYFEIQTIQENNELEKIFNATIQQLIVSNDSILFDCWPIHSLENDLILSIFWLVEYAKKEVSHYQCQVLLIEI